MKIRTLIGSLLLPALLACTTAGDAVTLPKMADLLAQETGQNGRACVRVSDIDGYGFQHDIVTVDAGRDYYLMTTLTRCHAMAMAVAVVFKGPQNEVCGGGTSSITSTDGRCTISKIFEFDDKDAAFSALKKAQSLIDEAKNAAQMTMELVE
ncbi:DUF6491 family protein [Teredinibacter purpureus]|jgi:hypothetical protein|uniref:DUF6491 family protein n=1 Tax=Teredinibacter purpureus TaxID=2731756 RepID=UPI0006980F17|nr:DUF6491 family protein [Teredinibacter purpureus]